jgi:hypothetical protein
VRAVDSRGDLRSGTFLNDVWELSLGDVPAWTQLAPTGASPGGRQAMSAVYDEAGDRMIVFGGYDGSASLGDVWALALGGAQGWTNLTPSGTSPSARYHHTAICDPVRQRMVVFGGATGSAYLQDVWELSLSGASVWTDLTPTGASPGVRFCHSAVHDPVCDRMVVFGGCSGAGTLYLNDTWTLPLSGTSPWTKLTVSRALPVARCSHSAVPLPTGDQMVVFGGYDGSSGLNDVWALLESGGLVWAKLTPTGTWPCVRWTHGAIYDPTRNRMVVFGGRTTADVLLNDVWTLSLGDAPTWSQLTPTGALPRARQAMSAIYDPVRNRMIVFGGHEGSAALGDVWALTLGEVPGWTELTPQGTPPGARYYHSAIYDPGRDRMIVFGGVVGGVRLGDVWALTLGDAPTWTQLTPSGTPPSARYGHSAIYDPVRDRMVVFSGYGSYGYADELHSLSLNGAPAWTHLVALGNLPDRRTVHSAIYDPVRDRMVVFGGNAQSGIYLYYNEVRALTWGVPALAGVTCPGDLVWTPGGSLAESYGITNPYGFAQTADYTLSSARNWPGFPISGSVTVGANATVAVPVAVPVPDSAAGGSNTLIFRATLRGVPQTATCSHGLYDLPTPVRLSLVSALESV